MLLILSVCCSAQDTIRYPINAMRGIRIGVDISKLALPILFNGERMGFEATADMHVKNNLFAVAEAGMLHVNLNRDDYQYRGNGVYAKVGVDNNLLKSRRPNSNDIVYTGARYGFSVFGHHADQITIPGYFWPDATEQIIPSNTMSTHWVELLLGVKAEVLKNLYFGLSFRLKFIIVPPKDDYSTPYLIPGYGEGSQGFALGINYCVSYNFHF